MVPSSASTRPVIPVSSATSRSAVWGSVSPGSMWPLGRHHSTRPARLRRAITAVRAPLVDVDDNPTGGALLDRGQPASAQSAVHLPGVLEVVALTRPL